MSWKKYLPTAKEQGDWRGVLSTFAEWHALAIGLAVGATAAAAARPELMVALVMIIIGETEAQGSQLKDVAKEPAYAGVSLIASYLAVGFGVNPEALNRLVDLLNLVGGVP